MPLCFDVRPRSICSACIFPARSPRKRTSSSLRRDARTLHLARSVCGFARSDCTYCMAVYDGELTGSCGLGLRTSVLAELLVGMPEKLCYACPGGMPGLSG